MCQSCRRGRIFDAEQGLTDPWSRCEPAPHPYLLHYKSQIAPFHMRHVIVGIDSLIHFVRLAGLNHSPSGSPQLARQIAVFCRFTALVIHQPRAWPARTTTGTASSTPISFYRATLCYSGICYGPVSIHLSVCQEGILLQLLLISPRDQRCVLSQGI